MSAGTTNMWITLAVLLVGVAGGVAGQPQTPDDGSVNVPARPQTVCNRQYVSLETCQNFPRICLNEINDQINLEIETAYTYEAMATFFDRDDVSYRGFADFFSKRAEEKHEDSQKLMKYMNKRGGRVHYKKIASPKAHWGTPVTALHHALVLEKNINDQLLDIHWMAQEKNDPHLANYLEAEFLPEQVDIIKKMGDWVSILQRLHTPELGALGWTIFDQELSEGKR